MNVSSSLGSPRVESGLHAVAYRASKAALNMFTLTLAQALAEMAIKVNAGTR